jgi:pimeloyl-ACP methyl ester carboxylesterase
LQQGTDDLEESPLDPPVNERLDDIACPTLVVVGDEDIDDMQGISAHVAASIPGARRETVAGASHLPALERPDEVNRILLGFLGEE